MVTATFPSLFCSRGGAYFACSWCTLTANFDSVFEVSSGKMTPPTVDVAMTAAWIAGDIEDRHHHGASAIRRNRHVFLVLSVAPALSVGFMRTPHSLPGVPCARGTLSSILCKNALLSLEFLHLNTCGFRNCHKSVTVELLRLFVPTGNCNC